jgi:signal transduction histidine kinase
MPWKSLRGRVLILVIAALFLPLLIAAFASFLPADSQTRSLWVAQLPLFGLIYAIATVGLLLLAIRWLKPLDDLIIRAKSLARSEVEVEPIETAAPIELVQLALAYNQMAAQMQELRSALESQVGDSGLELARRTAELEVASDIARRITTAVDTGQLLGQVAGLIVEAFKFDRAAVYLVEPDEDRAVLSASAGATGGQTAVPLGADSLISAAVSSREHASTGGAIVLPIQIGGRVMGVLELIELQGRPNRADLSVLQTITDQIAVALLNARLLNELAERAAGLEIQATERTHELEAAYRDLERLDSAKSDFIQIASHELRTPLTIINGYTQLLSQDDALQDNTDLQLLLTSMTRGTDRLTEIINTMLDVTKIESDILQIRFDQVRPRLLFDTVIKAFRTDLEDRHLDIDRTGLDDLPDIEADQELLHKAMYHLVINAIKFTPDGGRIQIRGQLRQRANVPDLVEFVIQDTGIGINPDHLDLIFEKFYQPREVQLHSSGKTAFKAGGPGLGLAIAKGIVSAHGGRIWAESDGENEQDLPGSKFYIHLPVERASD